MNFKSIITHHAMSPLLSIAIPTFNRASQLKKCLEMFATESVELAPGAIEIVISDNASSDLTAKIVSQWQEAYPGLSSSYHRNETNLGVDANCHWAIRRARGKYVWLFGDDDRVTRGAIKKVHDLLSGRQEYAFCFVNYLVDIDGKKEESRCKGSDNRTILGDLVFTETQFALSFASSCIFHGEIWRASDFQIYIGTHWYHMFVARDILRNANALLIGEPLVVMNGMGLRASREEKRQSDSSECEFYMAAHLKMLSFAYTLKDYGYAQEACAGAMKVVWVSNLRQILYYKATNAVYKWKEIHFIFSRMVRHFRNKFSFWAVHVPLLFLPPFIAGNIYWVVSPIYKSAKRYLRQHREAL